MPRHIYVHGLSMMNEERRVRIQSGVSVTSSSSISMPFSQFFFTKHTPHTHKRTGKLSPHHRHHHHYHHSLKTMSASTIDDSIKRYKLLQEELAALAEKRQVTLQQANENGMVQQELDALEGSTATVYKMMGPVLLRVELEDAKQNVGKRLDLIKSTMYVCV